MKFVIPLLIFTAGFWWLQSEDFDWPVRNRKSSPQVVVGFGDSLMAGKGATEGQDLPSQLTRLLGVKVINKGVNGDTTSSALVRLKRDVLDLKPDMVIISLGGNDIMRQHGLATVSQNITDIFRQLGAAGAMVVYLNIDPPMVSSNWHKKLRAIAKEQGVLWVDRMMEGMWLNSSLMADRVHPNSAGYQKIALKIAERIREVN